MPNVKRLFCECGRPLRWHRLAYQSGCDRCKELDAIRYREDYRRDLKSQRQKLVTEVDANFFIYRHLGAMPEKIRKETISFLEQISRIDSQLYQERQKRNERQDSRPTP